MRTLIKVLLTFLLFVSFVYAEDDDTVVVVGQVTAASPTSATDNFDDYANGTDLDAAANWVNVGTGRMDVIKPAADGVISPTTDATHTCVRYSGASFNANQYSEIVLVVGAGSTSGCAGVAARIQSDATTYYYAFWSKANGVVYYGYNNDGTPADISNFEQVYSDGNKLRLEVSGAGANTRVTVKHDVGAGWVTVVDAANPAVDIDGGSPGVSGYSDLSGSGTVDLDDWAGGDL